MSSENSGSNNLGDLFSDAVGDMPAASFGLDDVTAASARANAKRRRTVAAASTLGVVVLAVGVVTGVTQFGQTGADGQTVAAPKATDSAPPTVHKMQPFSLESGGNGKQKNAGPPDGGPLKLPEASSEQGDETAGKTGPRAGAPRPGCVNADRELATALAGELPAARNQPARMAQVPCPAGARGVAYTVRDGSVTVVLSKKRTPAVLSQKPGVTSATEPTRNGMTLQVTSKADQPSGGAPLEYPEVADIARGMAGKF
jgi:hypothetical protein